MKKLKQSLVRVAAAIGIAFGVLPGWAETFTDADDHVWTYTTNSTSATVTGVTPCEYDLVIPAELGGKPVTSFSATMFKNNKKIASIEIPDGVTSIGANAFMKCEQLQVVKFGAGIESIGDFAFSECSLLQKAELPSTTTSIGRGAFAYCVKLTTAKLPGVTVIPGAAEGTSPTRSSFTGYGAFYGCEKLKTLEMGNGLTTIGTGAFYGCSELYDVIIPGSVKEIGGYAFAECNKLYSVRFGDNLEMIWPYAFANDVHLAVISFDGTSLHTLSKGVFYGCEDLNNVVLPASGLLNVGEFCFYGCTALESIVIPDSVVEIGSGAFANCTAMRTAKTGLGLTVISGAAEGTSPTRSSFTGYGAFYGCTALTNVHLAANVKKICCGAFYGCSELPEITIPNKVTDIGGYAFAECVNLKKAVIGDAVRLIGEHAFYDDIRLETLVLGGKVQTIDPSAFANCMALKPFDFPDSVLTVGAWAFQNCGSLTKVTLPDSVGVLGAGAFAYCNRLTDVVIGNAVEEISGAAEGTSPTWSSFTGYGAFYGCTALTNVVVGSSVATIGCGAFYGCTALKTMRLPSCVTSIKPYAFSVCTALKTVNMADEGVRSIGASAFEEDGELENVTFGNRLQTIGSRAFQNCSKLKNVNFPDTLQTLDGWCFANCTALTKVVIPDRVVVFSQGAFAYCTALASVDIGDSVVTIGGAAEGTSPTRSSFTGYGAFYGCTALKSVNLGSVSTISCGAFYGCTALESVVIPDSVITIESYAFANCTALRSASVGTRLTTLGGHVFDGDGALHYVEFKGTAAPTSVGEKVYNGVKDRMTTYVASGSTGWTGLYQPGLPGTWQGKSIAYGPVPTTAANPYDFYPYTPTAIRIGRTNYNWPSPIMLTKTPYLHGTTVPAAVAEFKQGETIYLHYAFDEYWRGSLFENITNAFVLSGAKSASEVVTRTVSALDYTYCWGTNVALNVLQDLAPGDYTLTMNLNMGRNLAETDASNNSTSVTFTVVGRASYTVTFDAQGGTPAPASRTVYADDEVGELPVVTRAGYTFNGWYTEASGGNKISAATKVTGNATCFAQWTKLPNLVFWKPTNYTWADTMFVAAKSDAKSGQASFTEGDPVYLFYACYEADGRRVNATFKNSFTLKDATGKEVKGFCQTVRGISSGTCEGSFGDKLECLQGLEPGSYALTCELDSANAVEEFAETDNAKTVAFTVVAKGTQTVKVTIDGKAVDLTPGTKYGTALKDPAPVPGKMFVGWYTGPNGTGTKVTPDSIVPNAPVTLYAYWVAESSPVNPQPVDPVNPQPVDPGQEYAPGDSMPVTVVVNNITINITVVVGQTWGDALPAAPTAPEGETFAGWYTGPNGTGTKVTPDSIVPNAPVTLYANWVAEEEPNYVLFDELYGTLTADQTYDGFLADASGRVAGTITVKAAKAKKSVSKLTISIVDNGKKISFKGTYNVDTGVGEIAKNAKESRSLSLRIGSYPMFGTFGSYTIQGARNVFASKVREDKDYAKIVEDAWGGAINVVGDNLALAVSIAKKGKVKVSGTVGGAKVSATSQLLVGDGGVCCVPVAITKKANLAFSLWLLPEGGVELVGLDGVEAGKAGTLKPGAAFRMDGTALAVALPGLLDEFLPDDLAVQGGKKWVVAPDEKGKAAKAGKVAIDKKTGEIDEAKSKFTYNMSGLKLTYTAKSGTFKGSFKAYAVENGKLKSYTVNVTGVMLGDKARGTATLKKPAVSFPIAIE